MTQTRPEFDEWMLGIAEAVSKRSRDPSTKVGSVLVRPDKSIASVGYNGFPRVMPDKEEWWNEREEKYARVIHAEMNALLACKEDTKGMTLYVTHPPCENCTKHVAAAGIIKVVFGSSDEIKKRFNIVKSLEIINDCNMITYKEISNDKP